MKTFAPALFLLVASVCAQVPPADGTGDHAKTPRLHPRVYEAAGAFANEGFKFRDGAWTGSLQGGKPQRLPVHLFAGNQYWFCAATSEPGETPSLSLRDPSGRPVETIDSARDGVTAVGVTAAATGRYVIEIKGSSSGARQFCLLYLYK